MIDVTSIPGASSGGNDLLFGMSLAGLILASFFGLLGMAYLVYAKKQARFIIGLTGVALMAYPFFVSNTAIIAAIGVALTFLPTLLKRVGIDL